MPSLPYKASLPWRSVVMLRVCVILVKFSHKTSIISGHVQAKITRAWVWEKIVVILLRLGTNVIKFRKTCRTFG